MIWQQLKAFFKGRHYSNDKQPYDASKPVLITYACPNAVKASGGTKVIYHHTSCINQGLHPRVQAQILHPKQPSFRCHWDFPALQFKANLRFNTQQELYIIHEMWAAREAPSVYQAGISYAIFVQNGYFIQRKAQFVQASFAYAHAQWILCVSQDIEDCLRFLFPALAHKIVRLHISVDATLFQPTQQKENIITYMPRKLKKHADLVIFFLSAHLPAHWRIEAIDGLSPEQVASTLGQSKIFMSFSELEGLGLPPIEAALAGNKVIGYTGQGGQEFWHAPLFEKIDNGDIRGFAEAVLHATTLWDNGSYHVESFKESRDKLAQQYSRAQELADLQTFTQQVADYFQKPA